MYFKEFIESTVDYPGSALLDGLEMGVFYCYVGSDFLNGIVNYTKPVAGVLLERYDVLDRERAQLVIDTLVQKGIGHPCLRDFRDDVILLCTHESLRGEYYVFWFDCDTSDCCVGRFQTEATESEVVTDFKAWVESRCDRSRQGVVRRDANGSGWEHTSGWMELPVEYLRRGALSF